MGKQLDRTKINKLVVSIYKHLDYSPTIAIEKIKDEHDFSTATIRNYFNGVKNYVKDGRQEKMLPKALFEFAQQCIDTHVTKLTPKQEERCKTIQRKRTNTSHGGRVVVSRVVEKEPTVTKPSNPNKIDISQDTLNTIKENTRISSAGVKVNDNIKLFRNLDVAEGFVLGVQEIISGLKQQGFGDAVTDYINSIGFEVIDLSYKVKQIEV